MIQPISPRPQTVLITVGTCNTMVSMIILYCNIIILWDLRCICGLLTEAMLLSAWLYLCDFFVHFLVLRHWQEINMYHTGGKRCRVWHFSMKRFPVSAAETRMGHGCIAVGAGERSPSCPDRFLPLGGRIPGMYWIRCWLGPRLILVIFKKIKIFCPWQAGSSSL
jgi:hypothetical protein